MAVRIFNHYIHLPVLVLAVMEAVTLGVSVYAGAHIRFINQPEFVAVSIGPLLPRAIVYSGVMIASMIAMGLYHARMQPRTVSVLVRLIVAFVLGGFALVVIFYIFPGLFIGRGAMAITAVLSFVAIAAIRYVYLHTADAEAFRLRVLVLGTGKRAASLINLRARTDQQGFTIAGFVDGGDSHQIDSNRVLKANGPLVQIAAEHQVDEIVVATDDRRKGLPVRELLDCRLAGIPVTGDLSFYERQSGKVRLDLLYPSWLIFSDGFNLGTGQRVVKRLFDVFAASVLVVLSWPVTLIAALAILIEDGAPVLYRQERSGFEGKIFKVLKFRSMCVDAEENGAQWAEENDTRITKVGRVLRKYRIDELPQLFNVLKGEMSFVGPRPERPEFVRELSQTIPYYRERQCAKPGITGWAQLCYRYGASEDDAAEKLQYDLFYVKNSSVLFDMMILLQTAEVVLIGEGAR